MKYNKKKKNAMSYHQTKHVLPKREQSKRRAESSSMIRASQSTQGKLSPSNDLNYTVENTKTEYVAPVPLAGNHTSKA